MLTYVQQLLLANHDLKPVEPERRQWRSRNFVAFWIADSFNINTWMIASASILDGLSWWQAWICVWVRIRDRSHSRKKAVLILIVGWILHRWRLHLLDWTHRCYLSHFLPRHQQSKLRYLGFPMACPESRCHGVCMVRCPELDWRHLCLPHDSKHLAFMGQVRR
jgi:hypothetical protein